MTAVQPKMTIQDARYGVRLDYLIFPIDFRDLRRALAKNGYELSHVESVPPPPTRVRFGGEIGRKGETAVEVETDGGDVWVVGRSLQEAQSSFEELVKVVDSEIGVLLHNHVKFYWAMGHYRIATGKAPYSEIAKVENKECVNQLSKIIGQDLSSFSIRLGSKNATPNDLTWTDIAIEPDTIDERLYHVGVVFRNPDKEMTETFVKDLENKLLRLIKAVEA
jgi:energy-coupling factor transporter ATP-binding protein EcfA2